MGNRRPYAPDVPPLVQHQPSPAVASRRHQSRTAALDDTELLTPESTKYAKSSIEDYAERTEQTVTAWKAMNGQQGGDPAKLADALVYLAGQPEPPLRFAAGADAVAAFERRANNLLAQANAYRDLSSSLALDSD